MSDKEQAELVQALLGISLSLWMLWMMVPEHRRKLWRMRLLLTARRWTDWAARRAGAAGMRAELAMSQQNYALPYSLSLLREQLAAAYDRTRGVTP